MRHCRGTGRAIGRTRLCPANSTSPNEKAPHERGYIEGSVVSISSAPVVCCSHASRQQGIEFANARQ